MRKWHVVTADRRELVVEAEALRWVKDAAVFMTAGPARLVGMGITVVCDGETEDHVVAAFTGPLSVVPKEDEQ